MFPDRLLSACAHFYKLFDIFRIERHHPVHAKYFHPVALAPDWRFNLRKRCKYLSHCTWWMDGNPYWYREIFYHFVLLDCSVAQVTACITSHIYMAWWINLKTTWPFITHTKLWFPPWDADITGNGVWSKSLIIKFPSDCPSNEIEHVNFWSTSSEIQNRDIGLSYSRPYWLLGIS